MRGARAIALTTGLLGASAWTSGPALAAKPEAEPETAAPAPTLIPAPPQRMEVDPANYRLVLAGNIVIGLGGAGLIVMAVGLGIRADALSLRGSLSRAPEPDLDAIANQDRRISMGSQLAIAGGASAGALLISGITLVAVGHSRERKRRAALARLSTLSPRPLMGPRQIGASWTLRF